MKFPELRPRRLRYNNKIRQMVKETQLSIDNFIYPMFISEIIYKKQANFIKKQQNNLLYHSNSWRK